MREAFKWHIRLAARVSMSRSVRVQPLLRTER